MINRSKSSKLSLESRNNLEILISAKKKNWKCRFIGSMIKIINYGIL